MSNEPGSPPPGCAITAGTTVLVTGASSGIGAATAVALARRGATVGIVARRGDRLAEVLEQCRVTSPESRSWTADLSDPGTAASLASEAWDVFGGLDVLVNNAGAPKRRPVDRLSTEEIAATMRLNFHSPVAMSLALLPGMLERGSGVIVNVASFAGRVGVKTEAAYCASKFALTGWSEAMALDLWHTGVAVRLVQPGAIDTEIWDQPDNDAPLYDGDLEPVDNVATGIVAAIEGDRFEHYLPDMGAIVEYKTAHIDEFMAASIDFA
ncbi:MAG: SDR family NAD(P)-dependent oxidoreductase, partial [Actinobacteria bacterium]|nr:SDR family NAD(P)-dependent oxidoreductase [Actinomycetota bacterium]